MADKGSIHVETINSENHMILDCSNVDICGTLICANLEQTNPYYLNIGYNVTGFDGGEIKVPFSSNTNFYPDFVFNTNRYASQYPTGDFPTSGPNAHFWTPSQTGLYLVNVRLAFNSTADKLYDLNAKLVRHDIGSFEIEWVRHIFFADSSDEDFEYLSASFSTVVKVETADSERYRVLIRAKTNDKSDIDLWKHMSLTTMEITKLG